MPTIEPNFFIIGAPKCGTTTLHSWLSGHSDIYMPKLKELRFYSDDYLFQTIGFDGYLNSFFSTVGGQTVVGEATPAYFQNAETVIPRMKATLSQPRMLRFVVVFRNPADRAFSHYLHATRLEAENRTFAECVFEPSGKRLDHSCLYVRESLYTDVLEVWLENFDREQFFFARMEELQRGNFREDIASFLNISPDGLSPEITPVNVQATTRSKGIARFLAKDSSIKKMGKHILPPVARNRLRLAITSLNTRIARERQRLDPEIRAELLRAFDDDIIKLEKLTGLELGDWRAGTMVPLQ